MRACVSTPSRLNIASTLPPIRHDASRCSCSLAPVGTRQQADLLKTPASFSLLVKAGALIAVDMWMRRGRWCGGGVRVTEGSGVRGGGAAPIKRRFGAVVVVLDSTHAPIPVCTHHTLSRGLGLGLRVEYSDLLDTSRTNSEHRVGEFGSVRKGLDATSKEEPRRKQDWILKCLQGG